MNSAFESAQNKKRNACARPLQDQDSGNITRTAGVGATRVISALTKLRANVSERKKSDATHRELRAPIECAGFAKHANRC